MLIVLVCSFLILHSPYISSSHRPNYWLSMFWTWPSMTRTMTSGIGRASFASSLCPQRRVEPLASTLRNCFLLSSQHPSSSLHLKVQKPLKVLTSLQLGQSRKKLLFISWDQNRKYVQVMVSTVFSLPAVLHLFLCVVADFWFFDFCFLQIETTSSWVHCPTYWMPRLGATRSCPTGLKPPQTPPCATWRWRILCVQWEQ